MSRKKTNNSQGILNVLPYLLVLGLTFGIIIFIRNWGRSVSNGIGSLFGVKDKEAIEKHRQKVDDMVRTNRIKFLKLDGTLATSDSIKSDSVKIRNAFGINGSGWVWWPTEDEQAVLDVLYYYTPFLFVHLQAEYHNTLERDLVQDISKYLSSDQVAEISHLWSVV